MTIAEYIHDTDQQYQWQWLNVYITMSETSHVFNILLHVLYIYDKYTESVTMTMAEYS